MKFSKNEFLSLPLKTNRHLVKPVNMSRRPAYASPVRFPTRDTVDSLPRSLPARTFLASVNTESLVISQERLQHQNPILQV
jgi:hypothetical protein